MKEIPHRLCMTVLLIAAFAMAGITLRSQTPAKKPSFEVVSVKPSAPALGIRGGGSRGNSFTMTGVTLRTLLQYAYRRPSPQLGVPAPGLANSQIIGGPNWIDSDRFDIQAKAEGDGGATPQDQMQLMVQSMLEDRFQLKAHLETRELPIDNLVVGKGGPKIKPSEDQTPPVPPAQAPPPPPGAPPPPERGAAPRGEPPAGPRGGLPFDPRGPLPRGAMSIMSSPSGITLSATAVPITTLVNMLQQQVGRIVFDQTDLKGLFDFKLQFSSEGLASPFGGAGPQAGLVGPGGPQAPLSAEPMPSLLTAIQDLGLRLESTKGPVDVLVIEGVQKPSEN